MNEDKVDHGSPTYDRVAHLYDRTRGWPREVERVIGAGLYYLVAEATRRDEPRVLEVGAGTGRVAVPLAAHGACVCGIDVSREMLARLSAKSARLVRAGFPQRVSASMADALELPFPAGVFDAGLVVHVLHRLPDWRRGLAELRRVVRPDGAFVFGIDEGEQDEADWVDKRWTEIVAEEGGRLEPPRVERVAAAYEAAGLLEQEGYAVEEHTLVRWLTSRTPAGIVAGFRERGFSASWSLPGDLLERAATHLERELLDYFGSLDVELEREQRFKVLLAHPEPR